MTCEFCGYAIHKERGRWVHDWHHLPECYTSIDPQTDTRATPTDRGSTQPKGIA